MTIAEKITSSRDKALFTLYKEGMFYRCYNEDAMIFAQRVKAYKVNCKYVKSLGGEVLSLGFPVSELGKSNISFEFILEAIGAEYYNEEPHGIVFSLKDDIKLNYNKFQEAVITPKEPYAEKESNNVAT